MQVNIRQEFNAQSFPLLMVAKPRIGGGCSFFSGCEDYNQYGVASPRIGNNRDSESRNAHSPSLA
jgi:hypothetical protein